MKKLLMIVLVLMLLTGSASAAILEADKPMLDYEERLGIQAQRGVVLCKSLSVHAEPNGRSRKITTLTAGDSFITWESKNGWYNCYYDEGKDVAWVRSAYVVLDPMYYVTDQETAVYAYGDRNAPRVGLLDDGERLPILLETDNYCVVSLRGASGWIRKTSRDNIHQSWFDPAMLAKPVRAELVRGDDIFALEDRQKLTLLGNMLSNVESMGKEVMDCPFDTAYLVVTRSDGSYVTLALAGDACCVYRINGYDYCYAENVDGDNMALFDLFPGYVSLVNEYTLLYSTTK